MQKISLWKAQIDRLEILPLQSYHSAWGEGHRYFSELLCLFYMVKLSSLLPTITTPAVKKLVTRFLFPVVKVKLLLLHVLLSRSCVRVNRTCVNNSEQCSIGMRISVIYPKKG